MWLVLSFLTAVLTSVQDVTAKSVSGRVGPYVTAWAWTFFSLPILAVALLYEKGVVLGPHFWPLLVTDAALLTVSSICLFKSIQSGDLSLTLPLLGLTPLFLLVTSPILVHEWPNIHGLAGIFLIVSGTYLLYYRWGVDRLGDPLRRMRKAKSLRYMLLTTFLFSIGGNLDKLGALSSSPVVWSFALNATTSITLGLVLLFRVADVPHQVRNNWRSLFFLGCAMAVMMIVQMNAIILANVSYVIAVKRTSVIMSSLWGFWILKEQSGVQRIVATLVVVAGVFVISFAQ